MIEGTYNDRPQMLKNLATGFSFNVHPGISNWFFQLGCRRPDGNGSDCKDMDK